MAVARPTAVERTRIQTTTPIPTQIPTQFQCMDNEFEVAMWVANRPRILNLALDNTKKTSLILFYVITLNLIHLLKL